MNNMSFAGFSYTYNRDDVATSKLNISHCHDSYEILYVVSGKGRYLIEGAEFALRPRTLVFIRPYQYHCVELESDTPYERYVINFTSAAAYSDVSHIIEQLSDNTSNDSGNFYSTEALSSAVIGVFDRFSLADMLDAGDREIFAKTLLSELLMMLSVSGNEKIQNNDIELGARVIKFINDSPDKNISLDDLTKQFFVSKYYLCRSFKKHNGVSIHAYITMKRVTLAKQLIEAGETASGAAYKVGFGDYSAFYRAYVKVIGKPPTSK